MLQGFLIVPQVGDHLGNADLTLRLDLVEHVGGSVRVGLERVGAPLHLRLLGSSHGFGIVDDALSGSCIGLGDLCLHLSDAVADVLFLQHICLAGSIELFHELVVLALFEGSGFQLSIQLRLFFIQLLYFLLNRGLFLVQLILALYEGVAFLNGHLGVDVLVHLVCVEVEIIALFTVGKVQSVIFRIKLLHIGLQQGLVGCGFVFFFRQLRDLCSQFFGCIRFSLEGLHIVLVAFGAGIGGLLQIFLCAGQLLHSFRLLFERLGIPGQPFDECGDACDEQGRGGDHESHRAQQRLDGHAQRRSCGCEQGRCNRGEG